MSMYGNEILSHERLNPLSSLSNPSSDGYVLIDNTIGYHLDKKFDTDFTGQTFICKANGAYLDLLGNIYGVTRLTGESDTMYRERMINLVNLVLSPLDLERIGAEVYCYVEEPEHQITSSNPLLSHQYLIYADNDTRPFIERFINTDLFSWLEDL